MTWIAEQMALLDSSDLRFALVCGWMLLATAVVWLVARGREKP
jgi:hypothetical protein